MRHSVFVLALAIFVVVLVLKLLRQRELREKYAALWIAVGLATVVLSIFPDLLESISGMLGFVVPANLLFLLALLLLLAVSLHQSLEISRLEDETRVLSEEAAISRLEITQLSDRIDRIAAEGGTHPELPGAPRSPEAPESHVRRSAQDRSVKRSLDASHHEHMPQERG